MVAETSEASKAKVLPAKTTHARAHARAEFSICNFANQCKKSDFSA